jgi:hypothetical protein
LVGCSLLSAQSGHSADANAWPADMYSMACPITALFLAPRNRPIEGTV